MTKTEMNTVMALDKILSHHPVEKHSFNGVSEDKWDGRLRAIKDKKQLLQIFKTLDVHPSYITQNDYDRITVRLRGNTSFRYV